LYDVNPVVEAFSMNGGVREYLRQTATQLNLGEYFRRKFRHHIEILLQGERENVVRFVGFLVKCSQREYFARMEEQRQELNPLYQYPTFHIWPDASRTCVTGPDSAEGWECKSQSSMGDREVLRGS